MLSGRNLPIWNQLGLVATNSAVVLSIETLERALDAARAEGHQDASAELRSAAAAVSEDASPNSDGALRLGGDATVKASLILALRGALA